MGKRTKTIGGVMRALGLAASLLALGTGASLAQSGGRLEEYVDCAAYFGTMGEVSRVTGERETAAQYESSAGYAFESAMIGAQNNPQAIESLASRLNTAMEQMNGVLAGDPANSSILVQQYDDRCRTAMGSMPAR